MPLFIQELISIRDAFLNTWRKEQCVSSLRRARDIERILFDLAVNNQRWIQ